MPAWETGGDFYDCLDLGDGRVAVVVGDVSGKGVPAALYMVRALSELHYHASPTTGIDTVLGALNEGLFERGTSGMFVTLLLAIVHAADRTISYGSAGHLPPILRRARLSSIEALESASGMPLGVARGSQDSVRTEPLEKGDLVFLYTDGIIEARNKKGKEFGTSRMEAILARCRAGPEAAVRQVMRSVERFARGVPQYDDLTALAIKIG